MTTRRDPPDIDDLLNENGGEIGDLYRRLPRYEPPRRLDRAVLGEAARAVHSGRPPRRQRWMVGIGSAAGLVLAAGIAWRIGHDAMNEPDTGRMRQTPMVVPVAPVSEPAPKKHEAPVQEEIAPAPAAAPPPQASAKASGGLSRNAAKDDAKPAPRERLQKHAEPVSKSPQPFAAPVPPASPPPPAENAPAIPDTERGRADTEATAADTLDQQATAAGAAAPAGKEKSAGALRSQPSSPPSSSIELRRDTQRAPEDWLAHIHQLMREGRRQQATESLQLFQRAHPDWVIPDDLRPLLQ